jgi:hypothetical protein
MHHVLRIIETDATIVIGPSYAQELYLYLHMLGIYSAEIFTQTSKIKGPIARSHSV